MADRRALVRFANENIQTPKETRKAETTYKKAAQMVAADVVKRFPPDDMAVLERYQVARRDECIQGGSPSGQFVRFEFRDGDESAPVVPKRYCSTRSIPFRATTCDAISRYELAKEALDEARATILTDYKALINNSRYFEDVVEVWPGAEALRDQICAQSTALSVLSEDAVERIKASNIEAREAA